MRRRVALTGWGLVAPTAPGAPSFADCLFAGRPLVRALADHPEGPWPDRPAAWVESFDPKAHFTAAALATHDRTTQFAVVAGRAALAMAGLVQPEAPAAAAPTAPVRGALPLVPGLDLQRCGVHLGTGMASAVTLDATYRQWYAQQDPRLKPLTVPTGMHNAAAAHLALETGFAGANLTSCCACASSSVAVGEAYRRIRAGDAAVMLCGGAEALLVPAVVAAWDALRTLASRDPGDAGRSCRPFDRSRSGLVLGEGACLFVLEDWAHAEARGARILAEVIGYFTGSDSGHLTRPSVAGQAAALRGVLADAGLTPGEVGYINAHGTATAANDPTEAEAIRTVFPDWARLPVSSTKAVHGHLMGAAGAAELLACLFALQRQCVPPTANLHDIDPACTLDHVQGEARPVDGLHVALSSSFAFGGTSAVLALASA